MSRDMVRMAMADLAREEKLLDLFDPMTKPLGDGMVPIRVASRILGMQNQYSSRYLQEVPGIRHTEPRHGDYHGIRIDMRDVPRFVRAVADARHDQGITSDAAYRRTLDALEQYERTG